MSIIQDLYNIYDKEQAKYRARRSSQNRLQIELQHNLALLREGLRERLAHREIIQGLELTQFVEAGKQGLDLDRLQKRRLSAATFGEIREFERYRDWTTARLIETAYERIATLKKLANGQAQIDLLARLRNLFKLLMLLVAHIQGRRLALSGERPPTAGR
jgi:hypothetical protein